MKQYNQGFLKFGPMEECDTGEWVRRSDIEGYLDKYCVKHTEVFEIATEMHEENNSIMLKLKVITALLVMSIVAKGVLLGS